MKCFYIFKDKSKNRVTRSAPELKEKTETYSSSSSSSGINLLTGSMGLLNSPRGISELYEEKAHNLRVFSFSELKHATNDFSRLLKIGEGGFGCVYKGTIKPIDNNGEPIRVAIKKLKHDGLLGHKQWLAEIQFLGVVEHQNLVKLIGYCSVNEDKRNHRLLVYEYMPNKSLEDHVFNRACPALPWKRRLEIMLGAAKGLAYLHEGLEVQVIYRDFKSSNVLLDENFRPKLSDFGLAREGPDVGRSHVSTAVVGTHGYACPDYIETGHLTAKSDVWSYGVVLYELLTGRRSQEKNRPRIVEWVQNYPVDSKKFIMIMDPRLESHYSLKAARRIAKLADSCLLKTARERPNMSEVVEILKHIILISDEESSCQKSPETPADDCAELAEKRRQSGSSESWKRRMALLEKLGENVKGGNKRFLLMQKPQVT